MKNLSSGSRADTCGQTDMTRVTGTYGDYANASKNTYNSNKTILTAGLKNWLFYTHTSYVMYPNDIKTNVYSRNCSALLRTYFMLVNNQFDALFSKCIYFYFYTSTCFEQQVLIIRRFSLYQYTIWYNIL